ncbi:MAG: 50S ribosomal protein L30 [Gemmatimonadetes bacterium]|nr:50S ribosomal protein L30 [Gemmatimonadota bacterium]MYA63695.1 50S ribosomal protein L30 [Gemmatimonadota bacterium]MYB99332.1 50S ribosomal protein L30 [Gemmatimonadota bacterium]MYH52367.1 50S ribosomal protein L30 [Gemmatimonadota bacterium]MYI45713.1 50S ribosomal protein L30 [Gemmatimonadota bacterium]
MWRPSEGSALRNSEWEDVADRIRITQVRSAVGRKKIQRRTLRALGIRRHQQAVEHDDTPAIRGMIAKVDYLVEVTEVD